MKKALSFILAAAMVVALFAGFGSRPAAADDAEYTIMFASTSPEGSAKNEKIELVLKQKLEEKSGGRLTMDIYSSNTLAGSGEMLDALTNGIANMGWFLCPVYQGQFPYADLFSTPGLKYGTIAETDEVLRAYSEEFKDTLFTTDLKLCMRGSIGTQQMISTKEVKTFDDIKGLTCRCTSSQLEFYETAGVAGVSMAASDVYEGLKLGTIDATVTGLEGMKRNKLAEVASYAVEIPMHVGEETICMSASYYDSLPEDLQAVIDEVFKEMEPIFTEYTQTEEDSAKDNAIELNPDFVFNTFSDEDLEKLEEIGTAQMEAKAKAMDEAGLEGTKALEWLREHAK